MKNLVCSVRTTVNASHEKAFLVIVPIDLTTIFQGCGVLPAVVGVKDQTGAWNAAGQTRTTLLSDGSSAREELTAYDEPSYFSYNIDNFTGVLRHITSGASGEWWFDSNGHDLTSIRWSYAFRPRSPITYIPLRVVAVLWKRYMQEALQKAKVRVENTL